MKSLARLIKEHSHPIVILICGMPGTRKSTTAVKLAATLDLAVVIGMDEVRDIMQLYDQNPSLQGTSHDRWQLYGSLNDKNFKRGFFTHCRALRSGLLAVIEKNLHIGENVVAEGVHLAPSLYQGLKKRATVFHFILVAKNFSHHRDLLNKKFSRRHGLQQEWDDEKVKNIENIQTILMAESRQYKIKVIESTSPRENCQAMLAELRQYFKTTRR